MSDDPRWELLPHDPMGFFALEPGFDRRQLKRSYNVLLRRFKPERFPEEFQRIRAAFEALDDELRYLGRVTGAGQPEVTAPSPASTRATVPTVEPPAEDAADLERLLAGGPEQAFAGLRAAPRPTALDHYRLAVLSDVVDVEGKGSFPGWLLRGLRREPRAPQLLRLMHAYCQRPQAACIAGELLPRLAELCHPDVYGYLSEGLWLAHLRRVPFEEFARLFAQCSRRVGAESHRATLVLLLRVFRAAVFVAGDAWLEEHWRSLEEAAVAGEEHVLGQELGLAELLYDYRRRREGFLTGDPVRASIDRTLQAIAGADMAVADHAYLALQVDLGEAGAAVLDAFPLDGEDHLAALLALQTYGAELAQRIEPVPELGLDEVDTRLREQLRRAENLAERSPMGRLWTTTLVGLFLAPLVTSPVLGWLLSGFLAQGLGARLGTAAGCTVALLALELVALRRAKPRIIGRFGRAVYRRTWRGDLLEFLRTSGVSFDVAVQRIPRVAPRMKRVESWGHVFQGMRQDYALAFFSLARRVG